MGVGADRDEARLISMLFGREIFAVASNAYATE
jgi:hypothetical protein